MQIKQFLLKNYKQFPKGSSNLGYLVSHVKKKEKKYQRTIEIPSFFVEL